MPFPDKPRVKYDQNPLVEVVCQWVFDKETCDVVRALDAGSAASIHEAVREKYPQFNISKKIQVEVSGCHKIT